MQNIKDEIKRRLQNTKLMQGFRDNQAMLSNPQQGISQAINANVFGNNNFGNSAISDAINNEVLGGTAQGAGQGIMQTAGNAIGKAAPVVGGVMGGIGAANDFANGDYVNGGLNAAKTIATFIPGGQTVAGAIQAGQWIKDLVAPDRSQEMIQKSVEEAMKSQQASNNAFANQKQGFDEVKQQNMQNMQNNGQMIGGASQVTPQYDFNDANYKAPETTGLNNQISYNESPEALTGSIQPKGYMGDLPDLNKAAQNLQQATPEENKQSILSKLGSFVSDFSNGYDDNVSNGFKQGDLWQEAQTRNTQIPQSTEEGQTTGVASPVQQQKSIGQRLGEAVGTGARVMANPWTQAAIAGMITRATGGDWADVANNAYKYGTEKAKSDYYQQQINPNAIPNVLGNYSYQDYNAKTMSDYRKQQQEQWQKNYDRQVIQDYLKNAREDKKLEEDIANNKQKQENWEKEYNAKINNVGGYGRHNYGHNSGLSEKKFEEQKKQNQIKNAITLENAKFDEEKRIAETIAEPNARNEALKSAYNNHITRMQSIYGGGNPSSQKVRMQAPDGSFAYVDSDKVDYYTKKGAKVVK